MMTTHGILTETSSSPLYDQDYYTEDYKDATKRREHSDEDYRDVGAGM